MKIFRHIQYILPLLCASLFSCEDSMVISISDLPRNNSPFYSNIVIQGTITNELDFHSVKISESTELGLEPNIISNAIVFLQIGNDIYDYIESTNHPDIPINKQEKGTYVSLNRIKGVIGKAHIIHIQYNGKVYTAIDTMKDVKDFEIIGSNMPKLTIIEARFTSPEESLKFGGSYFNQNESYILLWNWLEFAGIDNEGIPYNIRSECSGFYFTRSTTPEISTYSQDYFYDYAKWAVKDSLVIIKKMSISEAYENFLIQCFSETYWNNSRFAPVSANVPTNVSNEGLGFFSACAVKKMEVPYHLLFDKVKNTN